MNLNNRKMHNGQRLNFHRWLIWGILVAIYLIVFFHRLSVGVIADGLNKSFGMNATQLANLGGMYFYAYTLMQIPTGILVDHLGPKKTVVIGSVVAAFGSVLFSLSNTILMAYLFRLLVGLGVSVVFLCTLKIQSNWFPTEKFATITGLTSFIGSMGGLLAQTPLLTVVTLIGWRYSFLIMGIITLILAVLAAIFVKNTPVEMGMSEVNPQNNQDVKENKSILMQLFEVSKNPRVWITAFVFGGISGGFLVFTGTFGISYLTSVYRISTTYAANLVTVVLLAAGIASLLIGKISDKLGKRKFPMIFLSLTSVVSWSIIVFLKPSITLMSILVVLIGITSSIGVLSWSVGKEVSNPKLSGISMSIVNVFGFIFPAVLMLLCGKIIDISITNGISTEIAYPRAFIIVVVSSLMAFVFSLFVVETNCKNIYNK